MGAAESVVLDGKVVGKVYEANGKWRAVVFLEPEAVPNENGLSDTKAAQHPSEFTTRLQAEEAVKEKFKTL